MSRRGAGPGERSWERGPGDEPRSAPSALDPAAQPAGSSPPGPLACPRDSGCERGAGRPGAGSPNLTPVFAPGVGPLT